MKLIAGLGNIGDKYCFTRHNAGFTAVDKLASEYLLKFKEEPKFKCYMIKFKHFNEDIILVKPATFMNLSGESVRALIDYYKIDIKDILIVYDDLSLDLGKIRFRAAGSDGGHNGIKSIIMHLGTNQFARLKIGIGPQPDIPSENFVLQNFSQEQLFELKRVLLTVVDAIDFYLKNGMEKTQNKYN